MAKNDDAERAKRVEELIQTLKSSGVAASTEEAAAIAEKILSVGKPAENKPATEQKAAPQERLPTVEEIEAVPAQDKTNTEYDTAGESKTLKELMDEDAEKVYNEEKKEENA